MNDWQTIVAVAAAAACGVWVAWTLVRPFASSDLRACGPCPGCAAPADGGQLLHIAPADPRG